MLFVAVLAIVFIGPEDLPKMMRLAGRYYAKVRRASDELRRAFNTEVAKVEAEERREEMKRRREEMERRRAEANALAQAQLQNQARPTEAPKAPEAVPETPVPESAAVETVPETPIPPEDDALLLPPDPRLPPDAAPRMMRLPPATE